VPGLASSPRPGPAKPSQARPLISPVQQNWTWPTRSNPRILGLVLARGNLKRWSRVASRSHDIRCAARRTLDSDSEGPVSDGTAALSTTIWTGWLAGTTGSQPVSAPRCVLTYSRFLPSLPSTPRRPVREGVRQCKGWLGHVST
jgi:hypothetical protein